MKVYEVIISGKTRWIIAKSKKAINDFFSSNKPSAIHLREDVNKQDWMFEI